MGLRDRLRALLDAEARVAPIREPSLGEELSDPYTTQPEVDRAFAAMQRADRGLADEALRAPDDGSAE
jgi:hypothetical protein